MSAFYTRFVVGPERTPLEVMPYEMFEAVTEVLSNLRSLGDGEWVGESEEAEMSLQHTFRHALYDATTPEGLIWTAPLDLSRDQRWAPDDLAARLDIVREKEDL